MWRKEGGSEGNNKGGGPTLTQPNIAFVAEPAAVCPLVGRAAVGTPPPLLFQLRLTLQLDREVSQWKENYGRGRTT